MRRTRHTNAGLSVIEILIIIVCICAVVLFAAEFLARISGSGHPVKARCKNQLRCLGTAMNIYLTKLGADSCFAEPADAFRGDEFIVILFWKDIVREAELFRCPATGDRGPVDTAGDPIPMPTSGDVGAAPSFGDAATLKAEECSYAGRCKGLTGKYAHRNTLRSFTEAAMGSASPMACDKAGNHAGGVNVVYFDSHVRFIPDAGPDVGAMHPTSEEPGLRYMDSGEK